MGVDCGWFFGLFRRQKLVTASSDGLVTLLGNVSLLGGLLLAAVATYHSSLSMDEVITFQFRRCLFTDPNFRAYIQDVLSTLDPPFQFVVTDYVTGTLNISEVLLSTRLDPPSGVVHYLTQGIGLVSPDLVRLNSAFHHIKSVVPPAQRRCDDLPAGIPSDKFAIAMTLFAMIACSSSFLLAGITVFQNRAPGQMNTDDDVISPRSEKPERFDSNILSTLILPLTLGVYAVVPIGSEILAHCIFDFMLARQPSINALLFVGPFYAGAFVGGMTLSGVALVLSFCTRAKLVPTGTEASNPGGLQLVELPNIAA